MELTYPCKIQLPAQCCALSEDEMTYLVGGEFSFAVGSHTVTVRPELLGQYALNFCINVAYVVGAGAMSAAIAGLIKGYQDGLSVGQTISHYWGRQNTAGRIATIGVGMLAGYYAYVEIIQIYNTVVSIVDSVKSMLDSEAGAVAA